MGFFKSSKKQRNAREQHTPQIRPDSSATTFKATNGYRNEGFPATGYRNRSQVTSPYTDGPGTLTTYKHRPNNASLSSNYRSRTSDEDGTVVRGPDLPSGIEMDRSDSFDLVYNRFGSALWAWIPHIMQPADDSTVINRVEDVFVFAEQFVNNFYVDKTHAHEVSDRALERVSCSPVYSVAQLRYCLSEADCHTPLIKHVLVSLLLDLVSFNSPCSKGSLLPKEFQNYNTFVKAPMMSSTTGNEIPDLQPALSSYRVLTAYVRSNIVNEVDFLQERQPVVEGVVRAFESAFHFWTVEDRTREDRQAALRQLLYKAGDLGIFLFSQPSVFLFDWDMEQQDESDHLIPVWPHLWKVYDEEARRRGKADQLITIKRGVIFREIPNDQTPAQAIDISARASDHQSDPGNDDEARVERSRYSTLISGSETMYNTSKNGVHEPPTNHNRESIPSFSFDDDGSERGLASHEELNVPRHVSSSTGLQKELTTDQIAVQFQPTVAASTAVHRQALLPRVRGPPESFHMGKPERELRLPQNDPCSSQPLPQQTRVLLQPTRTYIEDHERNVNSQIRPGPSNHTRAFSHESGQTSEVQQRHRPQNQHLSTPSTRILDGERPPPYSSSVPNQRPDQDRHPNGRKTSPPNSHGSRRKMVPPPPPPAPNHSTRASAPSLTNTIQGPHPGPERTGFASPPPPPSTPKARPDGNLSSITRLLHRRPSTSSENQKPTPNHHQHRHQRREREQDRDGDLYPPNAWAWSRSGMGMGAGNAADNAGGERDVRYSMIERAGRTTERDSDRARGRGRGRSSSLDSFRSFLLGDR